MLRTVDKIEGMRCAMREAHICETIRKAIPGAEKISASKGKQEAAGRSIVLAAGKAAGEGRPAELPVKETGVFRRVNRPQSAGAEWKI